MLSNAHKKLCPGGDYYYNLNLKLINSCIDENLTYLILGEQYKLYKYKYTREQ